MNFCDQPPSDKIRLDSDKMLSEMRTSFCLCTQVQFIETEPSTEKPVLCVYSKEGVYCLSATSTARSKVEPNTNSSTLSSTMMWPLRQTLKIYSVPDSVEELENNCFYNCLSLYHMSFGTNSRLRRIGNECFTGFAGGGPIQSIHIPDSVEKLDQECFANCKALESVRFSSQSRLRRLGSEAFAECGLQDIAIPDTVEEIGDRCFRHCTELSAVYFGRTSVVRILGDCAFWSSGIKRFDAPNSLEHIGKNCFGHCFRLSHVTFRVGSALTYIDDEAFLTTQLRSIRLPNSLRAIGDHCFFSGLQRVEFEENSCLQWIGHGAFSHSSLTSVTIPSSVMAIGSKCFYRCERLEVVNFERPSSLVLVGCEAFAHTRLPMQNA